MSTVHTYLLDFDDTLVVGPMTWAMTQALPDLITRHGLPQDQQRLNAALLRAQEVAALNFDETLLIENFLTDMGWAEELRDELNQMARASFEFTVFPDALPFLTALRERGMRVIVVSNNDRCPEIARELQIDGYVDRFFTPRMWVGCRPKPARSMFDVAQAIMPHLGPDSTVVVGDDPWSDAAFAANCGLRCSIVDRQDRFSAVPLPDHVQRVRSLELALPPPS